MQNLEKNERSSEFLVEFRNIFGAKYKNLGNTFEKYGKTSKLFLKNLKKL